MAALPLQNQGLYPQFTAQYSTNVELLLQQLTSMLRGRVLEGFHVGKMASPVNQFGEVAMKAPAGRFAPLFHQQPDSYRPWCFPQVGELPQLIDGYDELQTIVDAKSPYAQAAAAATGRAWDDILISQAFATRQLGPDAGNLTATTFSTTNFQVASTFGSSAASGLTVAKIIEARRILRHYHNNLEQDQPCMVIGSQQESDLLNQVQVVSTEFAERPVLVDGRIKRFLGFDVIMSERLASPSSVRNTIFFVKSGLYLGMWRDMTNRTDQRVDLSGTPFQLLTTTMYGALRLQDGKIISVLCSDTTGNDITP